jgi:exonuclease III
MKQIQELKWEIHRYTIIVGDFNPPLSKLDMTVRQKVRTNREFKQHKINQISDTDIYRSLYPMTTSYTFFPTTDGTFPRRDHILVQKPHLNR